MGGRRGLGGGQRSGGRGGLGCELLERRNKGGGKRSIISIVIFNVYGQNELFTQFGYYR